MSTTSARETAERIASKHADSIVAEYFPGLWDGMVKDIERALLAREAEAYKRGMDDARAIATYGSDRQK